MGIDHYPNIVTSKASAYVRCSCGWSRRLRVKRGATHQAASQAWAKHVAGKEE